MIRTGHTLAPLHYFCITAHKVKAKKMKCVDCKTVLNSRAKGSGEKIMADEREKFLTDQILELRTRVLACESTIDKLCEEVKRLDRIKSTDLVAAIFETPKKADEERK